MNGLNRPNLNLAAHPLRNRRFYRAALGGFVLLFLVLALAAGALLVRSTSRARADRVAAAGLEDRISAAGSEGTRKGNETRAFRQRDADLVAQINAAILRKAFSWASFFARLEGALPSGAVVAAMNPLQPRDGRLDATLKVLVDGLPDLLTLLKKLDAAGFKGISVRNEAEVGGRLVCEIGLFHESAR